MDRFESAWTETTKALPDGWDLSLRCASEGLAAEQRSDNWRAVADHPDGSTLEGCGADPVAALDDLRRSLARGSAGARSARS
jgi:hypothetical protein